MNDPQYLLEMEEIIAIGAIDKKGQSNEAIYNSDLIVKRGIDPLGGHTYADYIDKSGNYQIVQYRSPPYIRLGVDSFVLTPQPRLIASLFIVNQDT